MRKLLIWLLPVALLLSGCAGKQHFGNHREIDQLVLVQTMGVDRTEDLFTVTISTAAEEGQVLLKTPAVTLSRALKEMQDYTEKKYIFYGHTRHLLLGPSVLAHDLARCLDRQREENGKGQHGFIAHLYGICCFQRYRTTSRPLRTRSGGFHKRPS